MRFRERHRSYGLSLIGGFVLRLVSTTGFLIAVTDWPAVGAFRKTMRYWYRLSIYYFACTAYITFKVRRRWMIAAAGTFLNSLLLLVAMFWDHPGCDRPTQPIDDAFFVLAFFWMLFMGGHLWVASDGRAFQGRIL